MTTRKHNQPQRQRGIRKAVQVANAYYVAHRKAIRADLHKFGTDSLKTSLAALVVNTFLQNSRLAFAAGVALVIGAVAYLVGVPRNDEDDHSKPE